MKRHLFPLQEVFPRRFAFYSVSILLRQWRLALSAVFVGAFVWSGSLVGAADEPSSDGDDIIAIFRAPAPKLLLPKVMEIARKIQPGIQTEALPFILGSLLGDPFWAGISATENVGLVFVRTGDDLVPILLLKLPEASPLRNSLTGYEMTLQDFNGWSFAAQQGVSLSLIEGREERLIRAVRDTRRNDVEVAINARDMSEKIMGEFGAFAEVMPPSVKSMIKTLADEARAISDLRIGLNLSGTEIEPVYYVKAASGSALAGFLDQRRPVDLDFARFIKADGAVAFLGGVDMEVTRAYFNHLVGRFRENAGDDTAALGENMIHLVVRFLESTNGASGGTFAFEGLSPRMLAVAPTTLTEEELVAMLEQMVEAAQSFLETIPGEAISYSLTANHIEINGVSVHLLRTDVSVSEDEAAAFEEMTGMPFSSQDMYYAIVDAHMIQASDPERIRSSIEAVQRGESLEGSLASVIDIREESLFEFQVDLIRYFGNVLAVMMPDGMGWIIESLRERDLEPIRGSLAARRGEAEMKMSIPVETVIYVYQTIAGFGTLQQQMFLDQP